MQYVKLHDNKFILYYKTNKKYLSKYIKVILMEANMNVIRETRRVH